MTLIDKIFSLGNFVFESLVIVDQNATVNTFPGLVHTARQTQDPGTYSPWRSDPRLLAIPTSRSRVADSDPDYEKV